MSDNIHISVASDFSRTPGARYKSDGKHSAEEFLDLLRPLFVKANNAGARLVVDLDGVAGYASSFLHETFGRLTQEFGKDVVLKVFDFKSLDDPLVVTHIRRFIDAMDGVPLS